MKMKRSYRNSPFLICIIAILLMFSTQIHAEDTNRVQAGKYSIAPTTIDPLPKISSGVFYGYDEATRKIWINDYVYKLSTDYRVLGSPTKLGLLSAIQDKEIVEFKIAPNAERPSIPLIVEIRRKESQQIVHK